MRRHKNLFKILSVQETKMNISIEDFARSLGPSASIGLFKTMLDLRGVARTSDRQNYIKQALEAGIAEHNGPEDATAEEIRQSLESSSSTPSSNPPPLVAPLLSASSRWATPSASANFFSNSISNMGNSVRRFPPPTFPTKKE